MPEFSRLRDAHHNDVLEDDDDSDYDDDDDDFFDDDFTRFCRYRGQDVDSSAETQRDERRGRYVCLHYYSNTVGMTFGDTNVEVYRMDQIKEWSSIDPNWLDNLREMLDSVAGKN